MDYPKKCACGAAAHPVYRNGTQCEDCWVKSCGLEEAWHHDAPAAWGREADPAGGHYKGRTARQVSAVKKHGI